MLKGVKGSGSHVLCGNIVAELLIILLHIVPETWFCDCLHGFLHRLLASSIMITEVDHDRLVPDPPFNSAFAIILPF
jgi:hypothetical protein